MALSDADLGKILVEESYLSEEEMKASLAESEKRKTTLVSTLVEKGLLTRELFENAMAEHFKLPYVDVQSRLPNPDVIRRLPEEIAKKYHVVLLEETASAITVATSDPSAEGLEDVLRMNIGAEVALLPEVKKEAGKGKKKGISFSFGSKKKTENKKFTGKITYLYASSSGIEATFAHYRKPLATRFQAIIEGQRKVAPEILEEIFRDAFELRASDIHFEPQEEIVIVRFRVDGVMHEAGRLQKDHYEGVLNRIKIAGNMRTDEHFTAQDGAIRYNNGTITRDIRVSIVPVVDGEKVVMRLLSEYVRTLTLADLGFTLEQQDVLERAAHKPFGMLLTTGPTGSGKSTTLYALVKMRNSSDVNISTIEDPVEYKIPGINHIQVNAKSELTFAKGLRALVRQDPNIILVGEIRDGETADISVNAALTGHLLFSTLHANDAATAVPRLLEMGVEPFLLASTLEVIVGQRLLRRICPHCRYSYSLSHADSHKLFPGAEDYFPKGTTTLYRGKGCDACGNTGYRGRMGIYELMVVTQEIENLIMRRATSAELNEAARKNGMKLMFEDGFEKMKAGVTTIEELLRVAAPPDVIFSTYARKSKKKK